MSQAEHDPGAGEHAPEEPDDTTGAKLEDLETRDEQAAEVVGGNHPPTASWNRVRNIQDGG